MPSTPSRSSAGPACSIFSSVAIACVSSTSRARLRSSLTISSSNSSIAAISDCRHVGDLLDASKSLPARGCRATSSSTSSCCHELLDAACFCSDSLFSSAACSRHDVELPAGQLAGEPDVLAAAADRLRQLLLGRPRCPSSASPRRPRSSSTSAGAMALITNCAALSSYGMMSTRSPAISFDTACTREPRMPTHAPTGSMRLSLLRTAILARTPGSRAAPRMLIRPWPDFRHLELEQLDQELRRRARQEQLRTARLGAHVLAGTP